MAAKVNNSFLAWKQSRNGLLISGVIELVLAYIFVSLAIDSGSYWHYLLTFIFLVGAIHNFVKAHKRHVKK